MTLADSLIAKYLIFEFVNFYGIIIYIAVVNIWIQRLDLSLFGNPALKGRCAYENCMMDLTMQMTVIFMARSLFQHLCNFLEPVLQRLWVAYKEKNLTKTFKSIITGEYHKKLESVRHDVRLPQMKADAYLANAEVQNTELDGYNAATVQFGFVALFSVSFPIAPILAMFHNIVQRKIGTVFLYPNDLFRFI